MKLYTSPTSPFVRKVQVLIAEAGISGVETIAAPGTVVDPNPLVIAANPLGKIPALVLADGKVLYDSRVICRYLDRLAGATFYPEDRLWDVLALEAAADGIMDAAVLMAYEVRIRPEELRYAPWVEGQWAKVTRTLDVLEASPPDLPITRPDMAQIALACALGFVDFRHDARNWRAGRPKLAAWQAEMAARPAMAATIPRL